MKKFLFCLTLLFLPLCLSAQGQGRIIKGARAVKNGKAAASLSSKVKLPKNFAKTARYVETASSAQRLSKMGFTGESFVASLGRNAQAGEFLERAINAKRIQAEIAALWFLCLQIPQKLGVLILGLKVLPVRPKRIRILLLFSLLGMRYGNQKLSTGLII